MFERILEVYQAVCLGVFQRVFLGIFLEVCLEVFLEVCLEVYLGVCQEVYLVFLCEGLKLSYRPYTHMEQSAQTLAIESEERRISVTRNSSR